MNVLRVSAMTLLACLISIPYSMQPENVYAEKQSAEKRLTERKSNKADPASTGAPEEAALKTIERLLDITKYREAQAEWERLAAMNPRMKVPEKLTQQLAYSYFRSMQRSLDAGKNQEAIAEWERAARSLPREHLQNTYLAWQLSRAYVDLNQYDKAIQLFKPYYRAKTDRTVLPESVHERALLGERLILGTVVSPESKERGLIGRGQCTLCHAVSKGPWRQGCDHSRCGPDLHGIAKRTKRLLASPEYLEGRKSSIKAEAIPGSGVATNIIEYLAESNVCPSCYVVPGYLSMPPPNDRESRMPTIHTTPISLSREEMIAIDTWLLLQDGEEIPSVAEMRTAYDKFLPREEDFGSGISMNGILLASLYDAAGELDEAIRLIEQNYPIRLPQVCLSFDVFNEIREHRYSHELFHHLKERPDLVARFPLVLKVDKTGEGKESQLGTAQLPWCRLG